MIERHVKSLDKFDTGKDSPRNQHMKYQSNMFKKTPKRELNEENHTDSLMKTLDYMHDAYIYEKDQRETYDLVEKAMDIDRSNLRGCGNRKTSHHSKMSTTFQ